MVKVTYVSHSGEERAVDVAAGSSVMEGAVKNGVRGILADCGGAAACATCHVIVDEAWRDRLSPAATAELEMLDFAAEQQEGSRLSCQIKLTEELDGLRVRLPSTQLG